MVYIRTIVMVVMVGLLTGCGVKVNVATPTPIVNEPQQIQETTRSEVVEAPTDNEDLTSSVEVLEEVLVEVPPVEVSVPLVFRIDEIDDVRAEQMMGKSYHENETIQFSDLRYVMTGYYGFDGAVHQGALVVHKAIAEEILEIFSLLYEHQYPIQSLEPIDAFDGDDDASMLANNSSAFNYRLVSGTNKLSKHAYGLAVDINPLINPWVTSHGIYPVEGTIYADRTMDQMGMIQPGDLCYEAFISRGFEWGGNWNNSKDYQHFEIKIEGINN